MQRGEKGSSDFPELIKCYDGGDRTTLFCTNFLGRFFFLLFFFLFFLRKFGEEKRRGRAIERDPPLRD